MNRVTARLFWPLPAWCHDLLARASGGWRVVCIGERGPGLRPVNVHGHHWEKT